MQKPPASQWRRRIVVLVAVLVIGLSIALGLVIRVFGPMFGWADTIRFNKALAQNAVTQVLNSTLKPDADGVVKLPSSLGKLSLYDEVYVTTDSSGVVWVLFRTWQGKGSNLHGYLYRSTPATGAAPTTITVRGPDIPMNSTAPPTSMVDYTMDRQVDPNWYEVDLSMN